jgi:hypothetical protein
MPLHKNKILTVSVAYVGSLAVIISLFGLWHNMQLKNNSGEYLWFTVLLVTLVVLFSWFYSAILKAYRENIPEAITLVSETENIVKETEIAEDKTQENFDKDAFVTGIVPSGKNDIAEFCEGILQNLAGKLNVVQGLFYLKPKDKATYEPVARYAYYSETKPPVFKIGEGLTGQSIQDKRVVIIPNVPESYIPVVSGLGSAKPKNLIMIPVLYENEPVGLIEIAVFSAIDTGMEPALKELGGIIGKNIIKLMK